MVLRPAQNWKQKLGQKEYQGKSAKNEDRAGGNQISKNNNKKKTAEGKKREVKQKATFLKQGWSLTREKKKGVQLKNQKKNQKTNRQRSDEGTLGRARGGRDQQNPKTKCGPIKPKKGYRLRERGTQTKPQRKTGEEPADDKPAKKDKQSKQVRRHGFQKGSPGKRSDHVESPGPASITELLRQGAKKGPKPKGW